jgi:poly(3-hydroxybutyrate) depolymerase
VASVVLAGLVLGLAASSAVAERPKLETGKILKRTYFFKLAKQEMEYGLYLPRSYDKARAHPLVVALHGLHGSPRRILRYPGLLAQAEKHGCVVVAPMGYNRRGWYGSRGWNRAGDRPPNLGELSEKDVMNVLAITRRDVNVDPKRIYLMGHSMGGGGALHLGLKYPQLWAALAPIAPAILRKPDELEKIKTMPVIVVHGDADRLVSVKISRAWVAKMKALKMDHEYIEVAGGGHVKVAFDNQPAIFAFLLARQRKVPAPAEPVGTDGSERPSEPSRPR